MNYYVPFKYQDQDLKQRQISRREPFLVCTSTALEDCSEQCLVPAPGHVGSEVHRAVSDHHWHTCWAINHWPGSQRISDRTDVKHIQIINNKLSWIAKSERVYESFFYIFYFLKPTNDTVYAQAPDVINCRYKNKYSILSVLNY